VLERRDGGVEIEHRLLELRAEVRLERPDVELVLSRLVGRRGAVELVDGVWIDGAKRHELESRRSLDGGADRQVGPGRQRPAPAPRAALLEEGRMVARAPGRQLPDAELLEVRERRLVQRGLELAPPARGGDDDAERAASCGKPPPGRARVAVPAVADPLPPRGL